MMGDMIVNIVIDTIIWGMWSVGVVTLIGFVCYKTQWVISDSWEDAVKQMIDEFVKCIKGLFYIITDDIPPDKVVNNSLILWDEEVLDIVKRLDKNPYISPHPINYIANDCGVMRLKIGALGLYGPYKCLADEEIARMVQILIKNYYLESRSFAPLIVVTMATPTNVEFEVALSEDGAKRLSHQKSTLIWDSVKDSELDLLEEEIDLFEENKYDSGISL